MSDQNEPTQSGALPSVPLKPVVQPQGRVEFGVRPELPLRGFPPGRIRIKQRNTTFPVAHVKTAGGIKRFILAEHEGHWIPAFETGMNRELNPTGQTAPHEAARKD